MKKLQVSSIALTLTIFLVNSCGPAPKEYTLSEFNKVRFNSGETGSFVLEATVRGYGVDLRGSALTHITSKDGHKFHYVQITDGKTRAIVWMDSKKLDLPKKRPSVRITGEFVRLTDIAPHYAPNKRSIGWVKKIKILEQ